MPITILLRGGGDLASGVALRLHRAGFRLVITELAQPLVVRRRVAFAEAVFRGETAVEGVVARLANNPGEAQALMEGGLIPVLVDPEIKSLAILAPEVLIDARLIKDSPEYGMQAASLMIGLGPGFIAGENCHAVIETNRGHNLGRVIWQGAPEMDTGIPDTVINRAAERVLRAPVDGILVAHAEIGDHLEPGQMVAEVNGQPVLAPFGGVLRGLIFPGLLVSKGLKIGDIDPRDDPRFCGLVSDKSLAVAGGVLEAILSRVELRARLWDQVI